MDSLFIWFLKSAGLALAIFALLTWPHWGPWLVQKHNTRMMIKTVYEFQEDDERWRFEEEIEPTQKEEK